VRSVCGHLPKAQLRSVDWVSLLVVALSAVVLVMVLKWLAKPPRPERQPLAAHWELPVRHLVPRKAYRARWQAAHFKAGKPGPGPASPARQPAVTLTPQPAALSPAPSARRPV
jgi:hypothetical protein